MHMTRRLRQLAADERGDVPGWVLITLMTAGLTTPQLSRGIYAAKSSANMAARWSTATPLAS